MSLYIIKSKSRQLVKPLLNLALKFHPNQITWASLFFGIASGIFLYYGQLGWTLLIAPVCILLRSICNLLDGMVAIERKMTSKKGEALQEALDRISDSFMILGLSFSTYGNLTLGIFAISIILLTSYLGILIYAVGGEREYRGLMGKVDRYVIVSLFSFIQFFWKGQLFGYHALELLLIVLIIGGTVTLFQRSFWIKRSIK